MKAPHATTTPDLLPDHDLAGERPPKKTRQTTWREKTGRKAITANLPIDVWAKFHAKRQKQGKTVNEVIEHLLNTQYLRDR